VFDRQAGAVQSLRWELTLVSNETYVSRETQIVVECRRLEESGNSAASPTEEIDLTQALADLDASEKECVVNALRIFQQSEPTADRPAVAARLGKFLTHEDAALRDAGAQALARWSGEQDVKALVGLLESETVSTRWAAIDALGRLRAEQAAQPLAARLAVGIDRVPASRALTQIGPACEDALLLYLEHEDWSVRLAAVNILRDVGSDRSLAALQIVAQSDSQENVRTWANLAAETIEKRLAGKGIREQHARPAD
jgi:HEAT repeat protein